jgi:hypothetical protein
MLPHDMGKAKVFREDEMGWTLQVDAGGRWQQETRLPSFAAAIKRGSELLRAYSPAGRSNPSAKWERFTETSRGYEPDPKGEIYRFAHPAGTIEITKVRGTRHSPVHYMVDVAFVDYTAKDFASSTLAGAKALGLALVGGVKGPGRR